MATSFEYRTIVSGQTMDISKFTVLGVQVVGGAGTPQGSIDGSTWVNATIANNVIYPCGWRFLRLNGAGTLHVMGK